MALVVEQESNLSLNKQAWSKKLLRLCLAVTLLVSSCTAPPEASENSSSQPTSRLDLVLQRGKLVCGVSGELPGFSFVEPNGKYSGLDVDFCRAVAAALFDDPTAVDYRNLNAKERFTALQSGEIDLLSRNTTWTVSRQTSNGMDFAPVVFYDGQGIMVNAGSKIKTIQALNKLAICAQTGTTTELNLADQMRKRGLTYSPITFEDINATFAAYEAGRCQAITADKSALIVRRSRLRQPQAHLILDTQISKEPLAPAVASGDPKWSNLIKTVIYATIAAEELDITSANLTTMAKSQNSEVLRFLGVEGDLGKNMQLPPNFAARVIKHLGNYGEIYERNLGKKSNLKLERGLNRLWRDGGLLYAPPFR
ncbi:MAG: amino acid ABC transporter substrate-binding protein [Pseudanabaenaceae cyanobacterium bins.68]|nr:amino acid ABC transporter substrate-binding protein [Pseudanabaenaceae cyanobacterium bins.68]